MKRDNSMLGISYKTESVKPRPHATEGRAAYLVRMCIKWHNDRGRQVATIQLGKNLYQNLMDNIEIALEAKGEEIKFDEIEYAGTLISRSLALDANSGMRWTLTDVLVS